MTIAAMRSRLTDTDLAALERESWIDQATADRFGLYRVNAIEGALIVGRRDGGDYAGIVFPIYWPGNPDPREYMLRRDHPDLEMRKDRSMKETKKYLMPPGKGNVLLFGPHEPAEALSDSSVPIIMVEGNKKVCAAWRLARWGVEQPRFLTCGVTGVFNWRGTIGRTARSDGERVAVKGPIPDLARIVWKKRVAYIIYDSDAATNAKVAQAREGFAEELRERGADVIVIYLPALDEKKKTGFDDLLAEWGPDRVQEWLADAEQHKGEACRGLNADDGNLDRSSTKAWRALEERNEPPFLFQRRPSRHERERRKEEVACSNL